MEHFKLFQGDRSPFSTKTRILAKRQHFTKFHVLVL